MTTLTAKTVTLSSGIDLSYGEGGDPGGLPLLMLHGYTDSWRSFEPLAMQLPSSLRIVALSQRGHGDSGKPDKGYSISGLAGDAVDVLDQLGIERAIVVGHCWGSVVATQLAAEHPARVLGLVLLGATTSFKGHTEIEALWRDSVASISDPVDTLFVREFQESLLAKPVPRDFMDQVIRESLKVPAHVWRAALKSLLAEDTSETATRVRVPTRIIWGDRDSLMQRTEQDAILAAIPHASFSIHRGAGHSPHWEEPVQVAADFASWMRGLTALAA